MTWETAFGEAEIESALESFGGWLAWLGEGFDPNYGILALMWLSSMGEDVPDELQELAAVLSSFGRTPPEEEILRRRGLEKAFRDVGAIVCGTGKHARKLVRINDLVEQIARYSEPVE